MSVIGQGRASAYAADLSGKVLYELRRCHHCQYQWQYIPGSGTTRGVCLSCMGLTCQRPECEAEQRRHLAWAQQQGWILARPCLPFEDWCHRMHDAKLHYERSGQKEGVDFQLDQSGLYLPLGA